MSDNMCEVDMTKQPFKVGDRVRVWGVGSGATSGSEAFESFDGDLAEVCFLTRAAKNGWVRVQYRGGSYWVHERQCELVERPGPKVGDEVEITMDINKQGAWCFSFQPRFYGTKIRLKAEIVEVLE